MFRRDLSRCAAGLGLLLVLGGLVGCNSPDALLEEAMIRARADYLEARANASRGGRAEWTPPQLGGNANLEDPSGYNFDSPAGYKRYVPGSAIALDGKGNPTSNVAVLYSSSHHKHFGWLTISKDGAIGRAGMHGGLGTPYEVESFEPDRR